MMDKMSGKCIDEESSKDEDGDIGSPREHQGGGERNYRNS